MLRILGFIVFGLLAFTTLDVLYTSSGQSIPFIGSFVGGYVASYVLPYIPEAASPTTINGSTLFSGLHYTSLMFLLLSVLGVTRASRGGFTLATLVVGVLYGAHAWGALTPYIEGTPLLVGIADTLQLIFACFASVTITALLIPKRVVAEKAAEETLAEPETENSEKSDNTATAVEPEADDVENIAESEGATLKNSQTTSHSGGTRESF